MCAAFAMSGLDLLFQVVKPVNDQAVIEGSVSVESWRVVSLRMKEQLYPLSC